MPPHSTHPGSVSGSCGQPPVEVGAVHHHPGQRHRPTQLPDQPCRVERRPAGQLTAVEQQRRRSRRAPPGGGRWTCRRPRRRSRRPGRGAGQVESSRGQALRASSAYAGPEQLGPRRSRTSPSPSPRSRSRWSRRRPGSRPTGSSRSGPSATRRGPGRACGATALPQYASTSAAVVAAVEARLAGRCCRARSSPRSSPLYS